MSEITHQDYMSLVERIEKLECKVEALGKYVDKQLQEKYFGNYEEGRNWAVTQNATTFPNNVQLPIVAVIDDLHDPELQKNIKSLLESLEKRKRGEVKCFFESLSPEDRNKPMGISRPCRKCSPYSLGGRYYDK